MTRVFRDKCAECGHPLIAASPEAVMAAMLAHAEYRAWLERQEKSHA